MTKLGLRLFAMVGASGHYMVGSWTNIQMILHFRLRLLNQSTLAANNIWTGIWIISGWQISILVFFLTDSSFSLSSFENLVYKDYVVIVPRMKLWRTKQFALHKLQGNYIDQYAKIGRYAEEIRRTNRGSTFVCKLDSSLFQRLYVYLKACVDGFKYCRSLIGIDGCFLKGKFGG